MKPNIRSQEALLFWIFGPSELISAFLEAVVRSRFIAPNSKLAKKTINKLVDGGFAALETFAKRSAYCFAMGYFNEMMFTDLELIRKVRNSFAHSLDMKAFSDPEIAEQVAKLSLGESVVNMPPIGWW